MDQKAGYLRAKAEAEDADLLAACIEGWNSIVRHHAAGERIAGEICEYCHGSLLVLDAAIAKARGVAP